MILIPVHMRGAYRFYDDVSFFYALRMGEHGAGTDFTIEGSINKQ